MSVFKRCSMNFCRIDIVCTSITIKVGKAAIIELLYGCNLRLRMVMMWFLVCEWLYDIGHHGLAGTQEQRVEVREEGEAPQI